MPIPIISPRGKVDKEEENELVVLVGRVLCNKDDPPL